MIEYLILIGIIIIIIFVMTYRLAEHGKGLLSRLSSRLILT